LKYAEKSFQKEPLFSTAHILFRNNIRINLEKLHDFAYEYYYGLFKDDRVIDEKMQQYSPGVGSSFIANKAARKLCMDDYQGEKLF